MNQGEQQSESWIDHKQSQPKHKHQEVNAIKNATDMFTQHLTLSKPRSYQCIIYTGPFAKLLSFLDIIPRDVKRKRKTASQDIKADQIPGTYKHYSDTH